MPPRALVRALRLRIDGLTPAEYDAMSAWRYDEILFAQERWRDAQHRFPAGWDDQHAPR